MAIICSSLDIESRIGRYRSHDQTGNNNLLEREHFRCVPSAVQ